MKKAILYVVSVAILVTNGFCQHAHPDHDKTKATPSTRLDENLGTPGMVTGYVRDLACLLRNPKAGEAVLPVSKDCMKTCIKNGSPIGIISEEGTLYLPTSELDPDVSVREELTPYVGHYVKVTGRLFERGGMHSISVKKIEEVAKPKTSKIPAA